MGIEKELFHFLQAFEIVCQADPCLFQFEQFRPHDFIRCSKSTFLALGGTLASGLNVFTWFSKHATSRDC